MKNLKRRFFHGLMDWYKRHKQAKHNDSLDYALQTSRTLLKKARYGFYISQGQDGWSHSRYVQPIIEWQGDRLSIFVGTDAKSRKIAETLAHPQVTMAFGSESAGANLIVYGTAEVSRDPTLCRKHWQPVWRMFFPDGPESEDMRVVSIRPHRMELLDFKRNIIPEPFGLNYLALEFGEDGWLSSNPRPGPRCC